MNDAPQRTRDDGIARTPARDWDWIGIALALACGLAATVWRYRFIDEHTLELLALVMRAADPNFLPKDFFMWSGSAFGPRTPLLTMLGLLARALPFDLLYLGLTALTNVGLALVTFALAHTLYDDRRAPRLAAVLVSAAPIPALAGSAILSASAFEPHRLAFVLVLLGLYLGLVVRRIAVRGLSVGACASLATLVDPGLGLPSAALLLVVLGAHTPALAGRVVPLAAALIVPAAALVVAPMFVHERMIADESFVAIVAWHRHPELYTPGFVARDWPNVAGLGSVVIVTLLAGREWLRRGRAGARELARAWLALTIGVALLVLASWLFVERWPWRAWLLFTPLRTMDLLSWAALMLVAGALVERWSLPDRRWSAALLMLGMSSAVLIGPMFVVVAAIERWVARLGFAGRRLVILLVLFPAVILLFLQPPLTVPLLLVAVALLVASERPLAFALALAVLVAAIALNRPTLAQRLTLAPEVETWLDENFRPRWRSSQFDDDALRLARDIRRYTPPSSVILTPPDFGHFRLIAERAIVIDFHGLPDHDRGVAEWAMRMFDCYGPPMAAGADALPAYTAHYDRLTDTELMELGARYNANFAVVSRASGSRLNALFENEGYELVVLPRPVEPGRVVKKR